MKTNNVSIDNIKNMIENKKIEIGLYTGKNQDNQDIIFVVDIDKFATRVKQKNGWIRVNIYEYDRNENVWITEETYEKE